MEGQMSFQGWKAVDNKNPKHLQWLIDCLNSHISIYTAPTGGGNEMCKEEAQLLSLLMQIN